MEPTKMSTSKCFIVLGMHRSATSLTAKGLHDAGVYMGDKLLGANKSQPTGHYENLDFLELNRWILKQAGGSWDDPPAHGDILRVGAEIQIKELIKKHERSLWGWKDPRTVLTLDLYWPHLTNPHLVINFRQPIDVAKSLYIRNGMPLSEGVALTKEYNRRLKLIVERRGY